MLTENPIHRYCWQTLLTQNVSHVKKRNADYFLSGDILYSGGWTSQNRRV